MAQNPHCATSPACGAFVIAGPTQTFTPSRCDLETMQLCRRRSKPALVVTLLITARPPQDLGLYRSSATSTVRLLRRSPQGFRQNLQHLPTNGLLSSYPAAQMRRHTQNARLAMTLTDVLLVQRYGL
jgi:hypothetical protein